MTTPFSTRRYAIALPIRVFVKARARNTPRIGGVSLIQARGNTPERQAAACTLINWLISPEVAGEQRRFTGYFSPRKTAYY